MSATVAIALQAAVCAVRDGRPLTLTLPGPPPALPAGPFDPPRDRTLELGLRRTVEEQAALPLGYVEQLYTFGDRGRAGDTGPHTVSVGYLALTRNAEGPGWLGWYDAFPWEDWRQGRPAVLDDAILPALAEWVAEAPDAHPPSRALPRRARLRLAFGDDPWDEERVLERYELLYEAGLVREAEADGRAGSRPVHERTGRTMAHDHRRILATAIARLRAKAKYRPVVFELMPETFTLTQLQNVVETIFGRALYKPNFRRLVERTALVEPTGGRTEGGSGRPALLYRFRRAVVEERPAPGLRVGR